MHKSEKNARKKECNLFFSANNFVNDVRAYEELEPLLYNVFGKDMEEKYGIGREMTIAEFTDCLNRIELPEIQKTLFLEMLQKAG